MAIDTIAQYRVKAQAIDKVKQAIEEFVRYVKVNEPSTQMYMAWQQKDDPIRPVSYISSSLLMKPRLLRIANRRQ